MTRTSSLRFVGALIVDPKLFEPSLEFILTAEIVQRQDHSQFATVNTKSYVFERGKRFPRVSCQ